VSGSRSFDDIPGRFATRVDIASAFGEVVLPASNIELLRSVAEQVRMRSAVYDEWGFGGNLNRGLKLGTTIVLSSGDARMSLAAAVVVANELRLDLHRIDLSAVVSKYIGETEKNLRRLFDAAEDGGALMFFDEADALFGKRTEVEDSHDRYAQLEMNYLLEEIDRYRGIVIVAIARGKPPAAELLRSACFVLRLGDPETHPSERSA
jgi:hypothetical protein